MNTREQFIKAQLGFSAFTDEFKDATPACQLTSVSRSHFDEIKNVCETFATEGLGLKVRRKFRMPNQNSHELERPILPIPDASLFFLNQLLGHLDYPDKAICTLRGRIEELITPLAEEVRFLYTIHGAGRFTAKVLIAEVRGGHAFLSEQRLSRQPGNSARETARISATTNRARSTTRIRATVLR